MPKTQTQTHKPAAQTQAPEPREAPDKNLLPVDYAVRIHSMRPEGTHRATASVNLNGQFAIRGVKVVEGSKGLFVSMPSYKAGNGEYKDICFPCTPEARKQFDSAVLAAYQEQRMALAQDSGFHAPDPLEGPVNSTGPEMRM